MGRDLASKIWLTKRRKSKPVSQISRCTLDLPLILSFSSFVFILALAPKALRKGRCVISSYFAVIPAKVGTLKISGFNFLHTQEKYESGYLVTVLQISRVL